MKQQRFAARTRFGAALAATVLATTVLATTAHAEPLVMADFQSATTEGIVRLCTAPETDPHHQAALGYCVGYLTGAFHYYKAVEAAGGSPKLVCFKTAEPSRREQIENFVEWAKARPQYAKDLAIDSMFRYLGETHACPATVGAKEAK